MPRHVSFPARARALAVQLTAAALLAGVLTAVPAPGPATGAERDDFTFVVIPDTQSYALSDTLHETIGAQTRWIVEQREELNVAFVSQLGDLVETRGNVEEWERVSRHLAVLDDAAVPNAVLPGNHDMNVGTGVATLYDQYFPPSRYANASWNSPAARYGGYFGQNLYGPDPADRKNMNSFSLVEASGLKLLVLHLEYDPPQPVLEWAQRVLDAHPDRRVIVATHSFVSFTGNRSTSTTRTDPGANTPQQVWDKLIFPNCNIFLVVNGHWHTEAVSEARRSDPNACGAPVHQVLSDYQERINGGDGWLRYYTFQPDQNRIVASTYSPTLGAFETDADSAFTLDYDMSGASTARLLIRGGSDWRWRYTAGAWPAGWSGREFDDAGWRTGSAALGFGAPAIATNIDVPPPTSSRPLAALFRRTVDVPDAAALSGIRITTRADDGVVVRVNGTEVGRARMSPGTVSSATYANAAVRTTAASAAPVTFDVPAELLVDGRNVVAVSTHVNYRATPDLSFDLVMTATEATDVPPPPPVQTESFAVIGDVPYGSEQLREFPRLIEHINADPDVRVAGHIGDLSSPLNCSDAYYADIVARFGTFQDPLVYTPGDNEWTDCSRAAVGAGNPLERLAALRSTFFASPGTTLGASAPVTAQPDYPENVRFARAGVTFAAVHIVGSNNGRNPWNGETGPTEAQLAEITGRTDAGIAHIRAAFAQAVADRSRGVVLLTQADMFAPGVSGAEYRTAFQPLVQVIADEARAFGRPVLLVNGDTHSYASDRPLTSAAWLSFYGMTEPVPNLGRVTILGGTAEWTKVDIVAGSEVFAVRRVPLPPPPNRAPSAAIDGTANGLTVSVDGTRSTDPDGTVSAYRWDFGDGGTATGATASHTYPAGGTYAVTLTVTDDDGAGGTATRSFTVTAPPPPAEDVLARDAFSRTVAGGWGSADTGGPWTVTGTASQFSVANGAGRISLPAGGNRTASLAGVSATGSDVRATLAFPRPGASSVYVGITGRKVGASTYGARVVVGSTGSVRLELQRNADPGLPAATVAGLTHATGDRLHLRVQVVGTFPTTIRAKVWKAGNPEPTAWRLTTTDSTAALQAAGSVEVSAYLSRTATPSPLAVTFDDFTAAPVR